MEESARTLPDDLVLEVLARVADVAALFRCAAAAKHWWGLIADRSFLRRRWPENETHPSFLAGFFTQRWRGHGSADDDQDVPDCDSPPVFIPAPRSLLGPGLRSLPAGLLNGAKPLTSRRGLLLLRLAPVLPGSPVRLAVCDLLAGTCDVLPPLQCFGLESMSLSYAILTGEDCRSPDGRNPRSPAPGYSTFFKVLAMSFVPRPYSFDVEYSLHTFSSAEPGPCWAAPAKRVGEDRRCCGPDYGLYVKDDAVVCRRGMAHWLCGGWCSHPSNSSNYFTIDVSPEDGPHVSIAKLSLLPIRPTAEIYHLATVDGTLSLFLLYTQKEGLWIGTWTRRDGTYWYLDRVVELKPPKKMPLNEVLYLWSGEKSGTLLIVDTDCCKYVAYLETGEIKEVSSQFRGMVAEDVVPMEIDWPDLFMSRLGRH